MTADDNIPPDPPLKPSLRERWVARYNTRGGRVWAGILVSNAAGVLVCASAPWLLSMLSQFAGEGVAGAATFTFAIGLPMSIGAVAAYFWRDLGEFEPPPPPPGGTWPLPPPAPPEPPLLPREYQTPYSHPAPPPRLKPRPTASEAALLALGNTGFSLVPALFVLREGTICLIIAFPILFLFNWAGTAIGLAVWRSFRRVQVSLVPLLLLLPTLDMALARAHADRLYRGSVTTQVTVRAKPAQIYRYLAAFPPIEGNPDNYWLWRIGAPPPRVSRAQGAFVGAQRECVLGQNTVIAERITRAEPGRALFFRVTKMPDDPEIMGHLYLFRGGFQIVPRADGTCTLIGHTDYGLATRPGWYYNWWAQNVIHAVHRRVLDHIRQLAERDAAQR